MVFQPPSTIFSFPRIKPKYLPSAASSAAGVRHPSDASARALQDSPGQADLFPALPKKRPVHIRQRGEPHISADQFGGQRIKLFAGPGELQMFYNAVFRTDQEFPGG
jgi:hypothetical protein